MLRSKWNLVHLFLLLLVLAIVPTGVANAQSGTEVFMPFVQTEDAMATVAGGKMPEEEFWDEVENRKAEFVAKYGEPVFQKNVGNFDGKDMGPFPSNDNDVEYVWFVALNSVGCRDTAPQGLRLYLDSKVFEITAPNVGCAWFSGLTNPIQAAQLIISSYHNGEGRESITDSYVAAFKMDKPEVCPAGYEEIKFDSPFGSGTIGPITVEVTEVKDGEPVKFRWEANGVEVIWVQVKGGPTSNIVYYDPPATRGEGLMAPDGKGISHVVFCFKPLPPPPPPAECKGVDTNINSLTLLVTGTGTGENAVAWRVIRTSNNAVMDSGTGANADFSFTGEYDEEYQLQFQNSAGVWSEAQCKFKFEAPPPPAPVCKSVDANINTSTKLVTGTGTSQNAVGWRVVRTSDNQVMDSGTSGNAEFSFTGEFDTQYQLQFQNAAGTWSTADCKFKFTAPPPPPPAAECKSVDAAINASTLQITGSGTGENAVSWRVVETSTGDVKDSSTGTNAEFSFTGEYGVEYQLRFSNSAEQESSAGCKFKFTAPDTPERIDCIKAEFLPSPPEGGIPSEGWPTKIVVTPAGHSLYTFVSTILGEITSSVNELEITLMGNEGWEVWIGNIDDKGASCKLGVHPTNLPPSEQPNAPDVQLFLPKLAQ